MNWIQGSMSQSVLGAYPIFILMDVSNKDAMDIVTFYSPNPVFHCGTISTYII